MAISEQLGATREVTLASGTIAYRETGTGPTVVFVHGVFVNGDLWRQVVPWLGRGVRCITPDWPLGSHTVPMNDDADLSPPAIAALVAEFLAALDLRDVTLVGNDTGGAVCQLVAADHPDRVGRLVLTSCDAFEVFPPKPFGVLRLMTRVPGATFLTAHGLRWRPFQRQRIAYGQVMQELPPGEIIASYTGSLRHSRAIRRDARKVLRGLDPRHTLAVADRLDRFDRPVLVAWGGNDRFFPRSLAERLTACFPRARLEVVEGARTFVPEDHPRQLAVLVERFLSGADEDPRAEWVTA
ncbi:MAG TPA: alpha/beta hydrolase [Acidimicrobiia bacterium]